MVLEIRDIKILSKNDFQIGILYPDILYIKYENRI